MELDFSDQIRQLGLSSEKKQKSSEETHAEMDMQTKKDNPEMAMQNKSVCKVCKAKWGSCAHISDPSNKMEQEETMQHESTETKEEESKEDTQAGMGDKACAGCECGKNESECTCADCTTKASKEMDKYGDPNAEKEMKMEKSMSEKKSMHPDKEDKKDIESEKSKPDAEKEEEKSSKKKKFPFNKSKASLAEKIAYILQSKIDAHNEKHEQSITFAQLNKVYSRGLNVYKTTHRPRISLHQWAMARVNLFLKMKSGARVNAQYSLLDTDIANASGETIVESGLASYDFIDFTELEFQLAKISLVEAGLTENEMNFELIEAEEKKK